MWSVVKKFLGLKEPEIIEEPKTEVNYMVTVEEIRTRIEKSGWNLSEIPIRSGQEVKRWKLIAERGERSFNLEGDTLLVAMEQMGQMLGVWRG